MRITTTVALAAAAVLTLAACEPIEPVADPNITGGSSKAAQPGKSKDTRGSKPDDGLAEVVYKVGGSANTASLTYNTPSGTQQETDASLPWEKKFRAGPGEGLYISAQNSGGSGAVTCEIVVNDKVIKRAKSTGAYAVVSCDGLLGF